MGFITKIKEKIFSSEISKEKTKEKSKEKLEEKIEEKTEETNEQQKTQRISREELEKIPKNKQIIDILKTINDPELGIDIWNLGLIYNIDFNEAGQNLKIVMTFTSIMCPYAPSLMHSVESELKKLPDIKEVKIEVVFEPLWEPPADVREMLGV